MNQIGKMQAIVTYGIGDYRHEMVEIPRIEDGDLLVKVEGCGICAGDLKAYMGGEVFWGNGSTSPYLEVPAIGGHEIIGHIAEISSQAKSVRGMQPGDRVAVEQIAPCGVCAYCRKGQYWLCAKHDVFGFKNYLNGGFAEYVRIPAHARIYRIPETMPLTDALLIEPYACACHAINRAGLLQEDVVVISGCGTLGLAMITIAKSRRPAKIIALDINRTRLQRALQMGADHVLDPMQIGWKDTLLEFCGNQPGCNVYIEATGHAQSVIQGLDIIQKGGRFVEFSLFNDVVTCNWSIIGDGKELDIRGSSLSPNCFPTVIENIGTHVYRTENIVTHTYSLDNFQEAFEMSTGKTGAVKVALIP